METNKKQTALQLAIEQLHKQKQVLKEHFEEGKWNDDRCSEIDNCILICESKLPMEREQIEEDFSQGMNNSLDYFIPNSCKSESQQYYEQTYGK